MEHRVWEKKEAGFIRRDEIEKQARNAGFMRSRKSGPALKPNINYEKALEPGEGNVGEISQGRIRQHHKSRGGLISEKITILGSGEGAGIANNSPYITDLMPSKSICKKNEAITISAVAKDPDNDEITNLRWKGTGITNDAGKDYKQTSYVSLDWSYGTDGTYLLQCQAVNSAGLTSDWVGAVVKVGVIRIWVSYTKPDGTDWICFSDDEGSSWTHEQKP